MGPPSPSFAAEAHLLLHGPGPARIQPNTRLRRELCAQLASSPRFVTVCQDPLCMPDLTGESPYKRLPRKPRVWWFAASHANLLLLYWRMTRSDASREPLLDAGCGTGGLLARLTADFPGCTIIGLDADRIACARAAAKSKRPVCAGSVNAMPFADAAFGAIFSADVLCHRNVDE